MKLLVECVAVGVGGFLGALCRLGIAAAALRMFGRSFPVGTLFINLTGSFVLGWFLARVARGWQISETTQLAVTVGFLGAYTTFSTFMYESDSFLRSGLTGRAIAYLVLSVMAGLICVRLGIVAGQRF